VQSGEQPLGMEYWVWSGGEVVPSFPVRSPRLLSHRHEVKLHSDIKRNTGMN